MSASPHIGFRGIVDLSEPENADFAKSVELFCAAIGESDVATRLSKLRTLQDSTDKVLSENSTYAIELLKVKP